MLALAKGLEVRSPSTPAPGRHPAPRGEACVAGLAPPTFQNRCYFLIFKNGLYFSKQLHVPSKDEQKGQGSPPTASPTVDAPTGGGSR